MKDIQTRKWNQDMYHPTRLRHTDLCHSVCWDLDWNSEIFVEKEMTGSPRPAGSSSVDLRKFNINEWNKVCLTEEIRRIVMLLWRQLQKHLIVNLWFDTSARATKRNGCDCWSSVLPRAVCSYATYNLACTTKSIKTVNLNCISF